MNYLAKSLQSSFVLKCETFRPFGKAHQVFGTGRLKEAAKQPQTANSDSILITRKYKNRNLCVLIFGKVSMV